MSQAHVGSAGVSDRCDRGSGGALVVGASRGIGRGTALLLARKHLELGVSDLFLLARSKVDLDRVADECVACVTGGTLRVVCLVADLCVTESLKESVTRCTSLLLENGCFLRYVVCCAGVSQLDQRRNNAVTNPGANADVWENTIRVNLTGTMSVIRLLAPHLIKGVQRHGPGSCSLVAVSSLLARLTAKTPGHAAYCASKSGIASFMDGVWAEMRTLGVRVSVVYPGLVGTEMGKDFIDLFGNIVNNRKRREEFLQVTDVAESIVHLIHPDSHGLSSCTTHMVLQPQHDLYRLDLFAEVDKVEQKIASLPVPFRDQRVALITGAGKGIGRSVALRMAQDGYHLALIARTGADLEKVKAECRRDYPSIRVLCFPADVVDKVALAKAVESTVAEFGTISAVISNAGINKRKSSALASIDIWEYVVQVNLVSAMHLTALTLPYLIRHSTRTRDPSGSQLVFMNTILATGTTQSTPGQVIYCTTKGGLLSFARSVLEDVRRWGVKVSTILPGLVNTDLGRKPGVIQQLGKGVGEGGRQLLSPQEMIQPEHLANTVSYICKCSRTCCPSEMVVDSLVHQVPLHGRHAREFLRDVDTLPPLPDAKL